MALPKRSVGIVGLGIMGGAFARNLVAAGWHVTGFDIDAKARRAAARAGVALTKDVPTLAAKVPVIITSLPHPDALHKTAAAMVAAKLKPRIVVETSTFALDDKLRAERMLRRAGHTLLDCPISGTGAQAKVKDIVVFASGEARAIRRLKPLFMGFARGVHDLGAFGNGSRMKYVANLLVAIHNVAAAEAMVLGIKAGLGPQAIFETIRTGAGNSRAFELRAPMMAAGRYDDATMKIAVWEKDMAVIGAFAKALRCPTPLFSATEPIYAQALRLGHGRDDTAVVCAVLERKAGIRRRPRRRRR